MFIQFEELMFPTCFSVLVTLIRTQVYLHVIVRRYPFSPACRLSPPVAEHSSLGSEPAERE